MDTHDIKPERLAQGLVNFAQHLVRLNHFDGLAVAAKQGFTQSMDGARADAGLKAGAEINAEAVRFGMIQGGQESFA
jgi:hypothetical protein